MRAERLRYSSTLESALLLRRSWFVWAAFATFAAAWLLAILAAPAFAPNDLGTISRPIYGFFSFICHQMPERSFFIFGHKMAVCSRCFGVYTGLAAGILVYPVWREMDNLEPLPRFWLFAAMLPIGVDWSLGVLGIWDNTFASRYITGVILGIACATYILPAAVEVANFRVLRRHVSR